MELMLIALLLLWQVWTMRRLSALGERVEELELSLRQRGL